MPTSASCVDRRGCLAAFIAAARRVLLIGSALAAAPAYGASATYEYDDHGRLHRATLSDGTIVVYSYDDSGNRTSAVVTPVEDSTPPGPPTQFTAIAFSTTRIDLTWAAPSDNVGVTGYRLERCSGSGCTNYVQIATPNSASYSDTGRAPSTTYVYRVSARDAAGNWSPQAPARPRWMRRQIRLLPAGREPRFSATSQ